MCIYSWFVRQCIGRAPVWSVYSSFWEDWLVVYSAEIISGISFGVGGDWWFFGGCFMCPERYSSVGNRYLVTRLVVNWGQYLRKPFETTLWRVVGEGLKRLW